MLTTIKQNEFMNVSLKLQERLKVKKFLLSEESSINGNELYKNYF